MIVTVIPLLVASLLWGCGLGTSPFLLDFLSLLSAIPITHTIVAAHDTCRVESGNTQSNTQTMYHTLVITMKESIATCVQ